MTTYFTSDTHFGDHRVLNLYPRPYGSTAEMDQGPYPSLECGRLAGGRDLASRRLRPHFEGRGRRPAAAERPQALGRRQQRHCGGDAEWLGEHPVVRRDRARRAAARLVPLSVQELESPASRLAQSAWPQPRADEGASPAVRCRRRRLGIRASHLGTHPGHGAAAAALKNERSANFREPLQLG